MTNEIKKYSGNGIELKKLDTNVLFKVDCNIKNETAKTYKITVKQFNKFLAKNKMTVNVDSLIKFLDQYDKPNTRNNKLAHLKKTIVLQEQFKHNPFLVEIINKSIKKDIKAIKIDQSIKEGDFYTFEDVQAIKRVSSERIALMVEFLFQTGARVSEMINVSLENIKLNGIASISIVGKGGKQRVLNCESKLIEQIKNKFQGKKYLFENRNGKKYNRTNITQEFNRFGRKINIELKPHKLRHSKAMWMKKNGYDPKDVQEILGHSDVQTTLRHYYHANVDRGKLIDQYSREKENFKN